MASPTSAPILRSRSLMSVARKQLIVTGGAGLVGRNLVAALNERGEDNILVVDRLGSSEKWRNLVGLRFDDVMDIDEFRRRVREDRATAPTTLFHAGASELDPGSDADAAVDGRYRYSRELCEWSMKHSARFVYTSSAATYGDGSNGYFDNHDLIAGLQPLTADAFATHLFDLWTHQSGTLAKIAGVKLFDVYGPGEEHMGAARSMVSQAFQQIRESGEVTLFKSHREDCADGEQARDFTHVKDVVALLLFLHDRQDVSGLFNCGTGRARTFNELARAVFKAMQREPRIRYVDIPAPLREGHQYFTQADMTKARAAGFAENFASLEDGVQDYLAGHLIPRAAAA